MCIIFDLSSLCLFSQVSDSRSTPAEVEAHSSEGLNFDQVAQCENNLREPDDRLEDGTSSPHMNVIVKEEEEEEPLCGTLT